jgi:hypothetical protein
MLFSVSSIRPDTGTGIWQVQSGIWPDTGYLKRPDYLAGQIFSASLVIKLILETKISLLPLWSKIKK